LKFKLTIVIAILLLASASSFAGTVFFSNPIDMTSGTAYTSVNWNGSDYYRCFTDYNYDGSCRITDFHWWGAAHYGNAGIDSFVVSIFTDNGSDAPGAEIFHQVAAGDANAVSVGNAGFGYEAFKYSMDFSSAFTGPAGKYWFSTYGYTQNANADEFFWATSATRVFANDIQDNWPSGSYLATPQEDFAFELSGDNVVPEPSTLILLGLGLFALGAVFYVKK
jgi:hypothetical protein